MRFRVRARGRGKVEVAAYGIADAEHLVEKELRRLWPEARVTVARIDRAGAPRIVEEFAVRYLLEGTLDVEAESAAEAPAAAFRRMRELLSQSRYRRAEWEAVEVRRVKGEE